jgi:hypothetical protein
MATAEAKPRRTVLIVLLIVGLVLALFLACAGGIGAIAYFTFRNSGEEATQLVDELFGSIEARRDTDFYNRRTSEAFRQSASPEVFEQLCELVRTRLGKLESSEQESLMLKQNNFDHFLDASFKARFARGEGTIHTIWQRHSGEPWRLHNFVVRSPLLLEAMAGRACPHCGQNAPLDARFCPHCGQAIEASEPTEKAEEEGGPETGESASQPPESIESK